MSVSSFMRFLSCVFLEEYSGGLKRLLVTSFLVALLAPASASDPILTVDSGGHQPVIRDLKLSADGRYLVSGSRDKIIRVWDARTKKEVRKILGQVGEGPDGMVYAIALTPMTTSLAYHPTIPVIQTTGHIPSVAAGKHAFPINWIKCIALAAPPVIIEENSQDDE